jgi:hypothetical protein
MSTFKITNKTSSLGKRNPKYNSPIRIEYAEKMTMKNTLIKPGDSTYLTIPKLPLSIQKQKMQGYLDIQNIAPNQLSSLMQQPITTTTTNIDNEDNNTKTEYPQHKKRTKN